MLYIDVTSSCKSPMNTGVQRVVRGLFRSLTEGLGADAVTPVLWEPRLAAYCTLSKREYGFLEDPFAGRSGRRARAEPGRAANPVPGFSKWWRQVTHRRHRLDLPARMTAADTLFVPEIFQDNRLPWLAGLGARCPAARRVAVCHDAITWRRPDITPAGRRAGFVEYLETLASFSGVLAVSREASADLRALWADHGSASASNSLPPPVQVAGWPADDHFLARVETSDLPAASGSGTPSVLCVGTFEPRKNHLTLLAAAEALWREGVRFRLVLIGRTTAGWGGNVVKKIEALHGAGLGPVDWRRHVDDEALRAAYRECRFTVFPSLVEGYGLPLVESLLHARPCVCGGNGALGELAGDGGCLVVADQADPRALADAMRRLLTDPAVHARLSAEARARRFPTWREYVDAVRPFLIGPAAEEIYSFTSMRNGNPGQS